MPRAKLNWDAGLLAGCLRSGFVDQYRRRELTAADADAVVELFRVMHEADEDDQPFDEDDYRLALESPLRTPGIQDNIGVFDGEHLIAVAWVWRETVGDPAHWMHTEGGVHPGYRGRGIGTSLLHWQESVAPAIHDRHFPECRLELSVGALEHVRGARELFENEGYTPERWFFDMTRSENAPLDKLRIPEGLEIETLSEATRGPLRLVHNNAFLDHWRGTPFLEDEWEQWMVHGKVRPELSYILRDTVDGAVAGYVVSSYSEARYELTGVRDIHFDLIGTARAYRKRGVATALITHAVRESRKQGYQTASLGVDAENPSGALGVYERCGFVCDKKFVLYNKLLRAAKGAVS